MDYYAPEISFDLDHLVEVTLMWKNYMATVIYATGGNIMGASVLKSAIENFEDGYLDSFPTDHELNKKHLVFDDPDAQYSSANAIHLFDNDGGKITFNYDDDDLGDLVVAAKIIEYHD